MHCWYARCFVFLYAHGPWESVGECSTCEAGKHISRFTEFLVEEPRIDHSYFSQPHKRVLKMIG